MLDFQNCKREPEPAPAETEETDQNIGSYYYDDGTGYEIYQDDEEDGDQNDPLIHD